ncbi:hypothetical protein BOX15_Mlig025900g1, partial [Macrostomum lignano]
ASKSAVTTAAAAVPSNTASVSWTVAEVLSQDEYYCESAAEQRYRLEPRVARNLAGLLSQGATVPFIARYRRDQTRDAPTEVLRQVKERYEELMEVTELVKKTVKKIEKVQSSGGGSGGAGLAPSLLQALRSCTRPQQVAYLAASEPLISKKSADSGGATLAQRARQQGLEAPALALLRGECSSLGSVDEQRLAGMRHIVADAVAKDSEVLAELEWLCTLYAPFLCSQRSRLANKLLTGDKSRQKQQQQQSLSAPDAARLVRDAQKLGQYGEQFRCNVKHLRAHQILKINRFEAKKLLTVKLEFPEQVYKLYCLHLHRRFLSANRPDNVAEFLRSAFKDGYDRLLLPFMTRQARATLTRFAEEEALRVFADNLRHLLLQSPVRGCQIAGWDPGYRHGCKLAVIDASGGVVATETLHINGGQQRQAAACAALVGLYKRSGGFRYIAIGDGQGKRESMQFVSACLPSLPGGVRYALVSEDGASVYSASDLAVKELPNVDIAHRGAVSIARRLQDPLAELAKLDARHLGVGMYQHDISEKALERRALAVQQEVISFAGVDLNYAPEHLLAHVAGLNRGLATRIAAWRRSNGAFVCRDQLREVRGIGPAIFDQCAGFVRVLPPAPASGDHSVPDQHQEEPMDIDDCSQPLPAPPPPAAAKGGKRKRTTDDGPDTAGGKRAKRSAVSYRPNPLDATCVHPESYAAAERLLARLGLRSDAPNLSTVCRQFLEQSAANADYSDDDRRLLELLAGAGPTSAEAGQPGAPLFLDGVTDVASLSAGQSVAGVIKNVAEFGAFCDIGCACSALLHVSRYPRDPAGRSRLHLGARFIAVIDSVDPAKEEIRLRDMQFS